MTCQHQFVLMCLMCLQESQRSATLLGPACQGPAYKDHWPTWKDCWCCKEALTSYLSLVTIGVCLAVRGVQHIAWTNPVVHHYVYTYFCKGSRAMYSIQLFHSLQGSQWMPHPAFVMLQHPPSVHSVSCIFHHWQQTSRAPAYFEKDFQLKYCVLYMVISISI